jgi:2-polyprenyl-3-methyl-5-hydroxy-6-metoxy-1,4-benzoquinol methylase
MDATPEDIAAGHAFYTRRSLAIYDMAILGYFSRFAWKCPARRILQHYDRHVTVNHLDVGVGTGYFLDRCRFPGAPRLGLMDLNTTCLDVAARRVARFAPEVYTANVLESIALDAPPFDSVGMNYLLHCIPGSIRAKGVVLQHLKALLNPGGTVFGATLLHDGVDRNLLARLVMKRNNAHGIFSNTEDDLEGLHAIVAEHLVDPQVDIVGCVAIFSGRV